MKIIVCVKQVVDPEEPPGSFGVDGERKKITLPPGVPKVVSPFDRQAVEAALRIKDTHGGTVAALSVGHGLDLNVLRDPLSMGVDELFLLGDEAFEDGDAWSTGYSLAKAIHKIGQSDIIFCGRQDSENDAGQVGSVIAGILGIPCVTVARKIEVTGSKARIERVVDDGHEVISVDLPVLVTVSNELGEPRYPTVKQTMAARKVKPVIWGPADIDVLPDQIGFAGRKTKLVQLFKPIREVHCRMVTGNTPEEAGENLALALKSAKLL
jgi:electron transfer flavoprotein beta subunit